MSEEKTIKPSQVIIAYDATRDLNEHELNFTVKSVKIRGDILRAGDTLVVLGVLDRVPHPMGYQLKACPQSFAGSSIRVMEEEVSRKVGSYVNILRKTAEKCQQEGFSIEVKVIAGYPTKQVVLQEVTACNASWLILDRHLRRDLKFYDKQIPSKVGFIYDNLSVEILRLRPPAEVDTTEEKVFYSASKSVPSLDSQAGESDGSVISSKSYSFSSSSLDGSDTLKSSFTSSSTYKSHDSSSSFDLKASYKPEKSGTQPKGVNMHSFYQIVQRQSKSLTQQRSSEAPILCSACGTKTELYIKDTMRFHYSEIKFATSDFLKENLIGEGGYGYVYKGTLKDGQLIAAKVRKEASTQGFTEFHSELCVLSFARHKNIMMLLGYCCKENQNILVYEYICNKSLDYHLFVKQTILEWHQRHSIAIGIAKGLRFLHEECRGGPIIHRDVRPSNVLLTHDFVPMVGDFGLAKWKTDDCPWQTRILGTLGYLAPEYAENGILSIRTDVYAFGIVLLQLISGRKVLDNKEEKQQQSLRQWAEPLIQNLELHEVIDPRLGNSYDTYELYLMAKTAFLCVQRNPELRPSMGEVVRLLQGDSDHFRYLEEQFVPHYPK